MQRMMRVRAAKHEAARRRAAVLSIQKAKRGRAERAEREEMAAAAARMQAMRRGQPYPLALIPYPLALIP